MKRTLAWTTIKPANKYNISTLNPFLNMNYLFELPYVLCFEFNKELNA